MPAKAAHSTDGSLHQERYREQQINSSNKDIVSSSTLESLPKANHRYQSLLPTSWSQLFPKFIVDRKRSIRKTSSTDSTTKPTKSKKPLGDGKEHYLNLRRAYTESAPVVPAMKPKANILFFRPQAQLFDLEMLLTGYGESLGRGTSGTMYKTDMDIGIVVAVKRLKMTIPDREFNEKIQIMGSIDHKNVVPLMGCCCNKDEKLILYDYMDNGSLSSLLHGKLETTRSRPPLDWETRLRIVFGAVGGIEFLHSLGADVSHGNIKSSNVLITKDYDGLVTDFCLAQLLDHSSYPKHISTGYCAPEVTDICNVSQEADVYSFGVLLLEVLTGKPPSNANHKEGIDLPKWIQSVLQEEWTIDKVLDIGLLGHEAEMEMITLLVLAMECASVDPEKRPQITEVTQRIHSLMLLYTT